MEFMPAFKLHRPESIADAVKLCAATAGARYYAGGTDLVVNIRRGIEQPPALVDLTAVRELHEVREENGGIRIGAAVTLREIAAHAGLRGRFTAVAEAAEAVAGPTHRGYGTLGGNLCLDTRCIYYNQSEWWRKSNDYCLKERGEVCHVAPGGKRCFAAFSGDVAPALLVFGAEVELVGPEGARRLPLAQLYRNDGMNHLALMPSELVAAVHLPATAPAAASGYAKSRIRGSIDFPLAGAAARVEMEGDRVQALVIALTGVNPYPQLVTGTDAFAGKPLDAAALDRIREMVRTQAKPMKTTTTPPWYRRRVVGALARRLVARLAGA
jgi:4-hydroxybenzoyl-CoA reductase subunit beta